MVVVMTTRYIVVKKYADMNKLHIYILLIVEKYCSLTELPIN
jgi:hypothetical protein